MKNNHKIPGGENMHPMLCIRNYGRFSQNYRMKEEVSRENKSAFLSAMNIL